jgi:hypothetical protein
VTPRGLVGGYLQVTTHKTNMDRAIALMMKAARTSETLVNSYQTTRCYNPEDSNLHTHRRENLKSYIFLQFLSADRSSRLYLFPTRLYAMSVLIVYNASWNISSFGGFKNSEFHHCRKKSVVSMIKKFPRCSISLIGNSQHDAPFPYPLCGVLLIKTQFLYFSVK